MTEETILTIRDSDDAYKLSLDLVRDGRATFLEFQKESIRAESGKVIKDLSPADASEVGGWLLVYNSAAGGPEAVGGANTLYGDSTCLIVAGGIKDEPVQWVIQNLDELRIQVDGRNDFASEKIMRDCW